MILASCSKHQEWIYCEESRVDRLGQPYRVVILRGNTLNDAFYIWTGNIQAADLALQVSRQVVNELGIQKDVKMFTLILTNAMFQMRQHGVAPTKDRTVLFAEMLLSEMGRKGIAVKKAYPCVWPEFRDYTLPHWK